MSDVLKRIVKNLEYAILIIPLVVSGFQIYFSKMDTLSSWRGGGFGMYTEPHPVKSRIAFLINSSDHNSNWIRVYTPDERLEKDTSINDTYFDQINRVSGRVANRISFPSRIDENSVLQDLQNIRDQSKYEDYIYSPTDSVILQVLEIGISPDYESIIQTRIYERLLCLEK